MLETPRATIEVPLPDLLQVAAQTSAARAALVEGMLAVIMARNDGDWEATRRAGRALEEADDALKAGIEALRSIARNAGEG